MRVAFAGIFILLCFGLTYCNIKAHRSPKAIGKSVARLVAALVPPVIGNLIIISSTDQTLSTIGCYVYFLGMDLVMYALLMFTLDYCGIPKARRKGALFAYVPLIIDVIQELCNPFFGHAFATEMIEVDGAPYYRLIPYIGQTFHRVVDYGILVAVMIIFIVKIIRSPRIESERYSVILAAMIIIAVWETAYIFSRTPVDRAMVGFGVFGLIVYYLALEYRPMRLLDSMLAHMASEMPDALFFFDANGTCIWANKPGIALVGLDGHNFESATERLRTLFGEYGATSQKKIAVDGITKCYALEQHSVMDDRQRLIGSFLSIRDNTAEQEILQKEIFKATHDGLTGVYNRSGYDLLLNSLELETTFLLLIDADGFKSVNDTYGHEVGDRVLKRIAETVRHSFRPNDHVCRIGGDEFVVFMTHADESKKSLIVSRIRQINAELGREVDDVPPISVSVGIAFGGDTDDPAELFEHADKALYQTKDRGKKGYTFYKGVGVVASLLH